MKKIFYKRGTTAVFLIIAYLLTLTFGALSICTYTVEFQQRKFLFSYVRTLSKEYSSGQTLSFKQATTSDMSLLVYDTQGVLLPESTQTTYIPDADRLSFAKRVPAVLSGKEVYRMVFVLDKTDIIAIAGVPIRSTENNTVIGAMFLLRNLKNLPEAIFGLSVFLTICYWLSAYFIVSNIRKNKKLDELRQNYIANVTHALKTPVASIKALSETLCDDVEPDPDKQKVYYGMILQEANRQDHMIRDILELSKLQSSGMDFSKTTLHAAEIFQPVLDKYATLCDCMDITLHTPENLDALPPLRTNAPCVKQLLEILLDNALKFVPEGGNIWVDASLSGRVATICVRDDGVGISEEALPQVFDRFFKGSHDFNSSGSGLGLAIAKEITNGLKERIWAESEVGTGSAFFFTLHLK